MAEWTPEAGRRLQQYLDRVAELSRAQGDDANEITEQLRAHITTETESESGSVVTVEHLERSLAALGTPEQVVGVESALAPPVTNQSAPPAPRGCGKFTRTLIWLFGVLIPAGSLVFELIIGAMAEMYKDPVPTWGHLAAGIGLLLSIVYVDLVIAALPSRKQVSPWAITLNAYAAVVGMVYFLIYLPVLPIAVYCLLFLGLGLMGFSPMFVFAASVGQMRILYRNFDALGLDRRWAIKRSVLGAALGAALLGALDGPNLASQTLLHMAVSDDAQTRSRATWWLETLHMDTYVLEACYHPVVRGIGLTRRWSESDIANRRAYRELYFRMTGTAYNSVAKPDSVFTLSGRPTARNWQSQQVTDSEVGGAEVAGRVNGLSLSSSTLDVNVSSAADGSTGPSVAYIEWTVEFKNASNVEREARGQLALPHGAVASRLTLWINGEEREAAFGTRGQVREAYQQVAVVQRRDPALLSVTGPDTALLQCFPVAAQGVMKAKVGITAPLTIRNGKASLRLPYFEERNFDIPGSLEHRVWAESASASFTGPHALTKDGSGGKYSVHGKLSDTELSSWTSGVIEAVAPRLPAPPYTDTLGSTSATMEFRPYPAPPKDATNICLVIDGSVSMASLGKSFDWRDMVNAFPAGAMVNAVFAGRDVTVWSTNFEPPSAALAEWLTVRDYRGGCDPVPALERAWEMTASKPHGVMLWLHGPLPVELSSIDGLTQWLGRRPTTPSGDLVRVLEIPLVPGPNRVVEKCGDLAGIERVALLNSPKETLAYAAHALHGEDVERAFVLGDTTTPSPASPNADGTSSTHLVRLAISQRVHEAMRRQNKKEQAELAPRAVSARLVTPLSGAVVLEHQAQYAQHGLDPARNEEAIPGIPEPEEWALMLIAAAALGLMAFRARTRRFANVRSVA